MSNEQMNVRGSDGREFLPGFSAPFEHLLRLQRDEHTDRPTVPLPLAFLLTAVAFWLGLYRLLIPFSEAVVAALPVERHSHPGRSLQFFFYDTPKVLLLLFVGTVAIGILALGFIFNAIL